MKSGLDPEQRAMNRRLGVSDETFAKHNPAMTLARL
jgi:hypothetical protein